MGLYRVVVLAPVVIDVAARDHLGAKRAAVDAVQRSQANGSTEYPPVAMRSERMPEHSALAMPKARA